MKFKVNRYWTTFEIVEIEAESEDDALDKLDSINTDEAQLLENLEIWKDANEIFIND